METDKQEKKQTNREYYSYIADRFVMERPSRDIIISTLEDVDTHGANRGYEHAFSVIRKFKEFQRKRLKESFNSCWDHISDLCSKQVPINNENKE
jgi:hypothetical protein